MSMNSGNPLDQLRPNHLPDPVNFWPLAPGWWISALLLITLLTTVTIWTIRYVRRTRYRRQARRTAISLFEQFQQHNNCLQYANDCNRLLKQTALRAFPAEQVARLHGKQWLEFLADSAHLPEFTGQAGDALGDQRYRQQPSVDVAQLHSLTLSWIRKHHV